VAVRVAGKPTEYAECSCGITRRRRLERLFRTAFSGDIARYQGQTFAGWVDAAARKEPGYRAEAQGLVALLEDWSAHEQGPRSSLALIGAPGRGKSSLATIVMARRIERQLCDALYVTAPDLLDRIRATYGPHGEGSEPEVVDAVKTASLLVLDDLGAEKPSEWVEEKLYQVVNHRYNALLPTIFTSNLEIRALTRRVGQRIVDRVVDMSTLVYLGGPNLRETEDAWQ
jgi:DNA replication protein DnaC